MEDVELQLHFVGGTVLTIAVDGDTVKTLLDAFARHETSTCTLVHGRWTWTFSYDKLVAVGCKEISRGTPPGACGMFEQQQRRLD
jgi:hypothetical protein